MRLEFIGRSTALILAAWSLLGNAHGFAEPTKLTAEETAFFETHIRPIFVTECIECHGAEKQKGGLRLDSRKGWQKGGESGASIVPKDPEGSLLLRSIKHLEPELKMPEKAPKLDDSVLQNFTRWIAMGAPDPRDEPPLAAAQKPAWPELLAARRSWWSLQPLRPTTELLAFANTHETKHASSTAPKNSIDQFLNTSLFKAGLTPEAPASPEILVRRLHFILVGLPPSPDDVHTFRAAHALDPKKAVRDRAQTLLNSPHFGEHWARHWMDLVRYAESHGSESDPEIPAAYQYRDYLIRAFNADVPLDQLIREHLAGDLLPRPRLSAEGINESRIGPAHLRMCDHGFQPVDSLDDQIKAVDNQIDVVSKAFQALTVSCARCHDHKFDAISQRDYTALYGIFSSVRPAQLPIESDEHLQLSKKVELAKLKSTIRNELSAVWLSQLRSFPAAVAQAVSPPLEKGVAELQERLANGNKTLAQKQWASVTSGAPKQSPAPYAIWNFSRDANDQLGRVRSELVGGATVKDGALLLDGKGAFLRTEPLPVEITEKTFEAWLSTSNLEQHGGGIVGLEQIKTHAFDTVVYAEKQRRKWLAGSNNHRRSEQTEGAEENSGTNDTIHVAISYAADGRISVFQNGKPYGKPFRKDALQTYPAGDSRLLIGLRHTGAGSGFFEGTIREVRLYTRALSEEEVAASFAGGMLPKTTTIQSEKNTEKADPELDALSAEAKKLQTEIAAKVPGTEREPLSKATAAAEHPLHMAYKAATTAPGTFAAGLSAYRSKMETVIRGAKEFNAENFSESWDLAGANQASWFVSGPDTAPVACGDFRVEREGDKALVSLLPSGIGGSTMVPQFGGVAMSPEFKITTKNISVKFAATNGAMLRVICDNYPLGTNSIFPRAIVQRKDSAWSVLDTEYRMNTSAFLEMSTPGHQTRRAEPPKGAAGVASNEPFFVVEKVLFHNGKAAPKEVHPTLELLLEKCTRPEPQGYLLELGNCLAEAVKAWREGTLSEAQRGLLDSALQTGLLSTTASATPALGQAVSKYRGLTKAMPTPTFAPGVLEHRARDAAFLPRGDYKKPGDTVPRGFLEVLDKKAIAGEQSGRLELAERMLSDANPLTSRVMANRIWLWTFGSGIVGTPDNFGRMGEKPTHPELLDFLAAKLKSEGWSLKTSLLQLVDTDAFQRSSTVSETAAKVDPLNTLLSHAHVRRLEAESIRDGLLSVSGKLDTTLLGPSVAATAPRRSVYLQLRRNSLPPLLTTFDAPKPFTTLGRRDSTTVPAQSLTLMNDPAIMQLAKSWADSLKAKIPDRNGRIDSMFEKALGRPPSREETEKAKALLGSFGAEDDLAPLAHALFNLKEFIYLR